MNNVFFDDKDLIKRNLPKWPAFMVCGKKVTPNQAAEIIIRTDSNMPDFSYAGNDREHAYELNALFGINTSETFSMPDAERSLLWKKIYDLREKMGILSLEYLSNRQIVSSYIGGPHGWCSWGGDIFCNSYNIGKWPSVGEVAREWGVVAETFPYLDLRCRLFSGETCEPGEPVVDFVVSDGIVVVVEPRGPLAAVVSLDLERIVISMRSGFISREWGITINSLKEKLETVYGAVPQLS